MTALNVVMGVVAAVIGSGVGGYTSHRVSRWVDTRRGVK